MQDTHMSSTEVTYANRSKRFKAWLKNHDMTPAEASRKIGMSRAYLTGLVNGKRPFGENAARSIEQSFRMGDKYLDQTEDKGLEPVMVWSKPEDLLPGVHVLVPRVSVSLSAGSGSVVSKEELLPPLAFTEEWIRSKGVTSRENLRVCKVSGDSMEPYLMENDSVLIDLGQVSVLDNKVYALRYGEEIRIKRLSRRFDGGLIIRSDNKDYPDESLSPEQCSQISVIGRQIWRAG